MFIAEMSARKDERIGKKQSPADQLRAPGQEENRERPSAIATQPKLSASFPP